MEKEMNKLYREIAETVNEMIPEEWKRFYFYAQISDDENDKKLIDRYYNKFPENPI